MVSIGEVLNSEEYKNADVVERWVIINQLKRDCEKKLEELKKEAIPIVSENDNFVKTSFGNAKLNRKTTKKYDMDELYLFLEDKGVLDQVRSDGVDLKKLQQMLKSGQLSEEEIKQFITETKTKYLSS